jgi:hypothetical protein
MTNTNAAILRLTLASAASLVVLFAGDKLSPSNPDALITSAAARGGRPATPMSYAGVASRTARPDPNMAGSAEGRDPYVAGTAERRDSNVAGAAASDTAVTQSPVIRNPYVAGDAATSYAGVAQRSVIRNPYVGATAGVYTDCEQVTDEYGNVSVQC